MKTSRVFILLSFVSLISGEQFQFSRLGKAFAVEDVLMLNLQLHLSPLYSGCQYWRNLVYNSSKPFSQFSKTGLTRTNITVTHACHLVHSFPAIAQFPSENRKPRQILTALASFSLGTIFSSLSEKLFGHSNFQEIQFNLKHLDDRFTALQEQVDRSERILERLIHEEEEISIFVAADSFLATVREVSQAISQLYDQQLPLSLVAGVDAQAIFSDLRSIAEKRRLELPFVSFDQIFQFPVTFQPDTQNQLLNIQLSIPLIKKKFDVYHLLQQEVVATHRNETLMLKIQTPSSLLALSPNKAEFATFTQEQFEACFNFQGVHFCHINVFYKNMSETCISSLYQGQLTQIDQQCQIVPTFKRWNLILTSSELVVASLDSLTVHEHCSNSSRVFNLKGTHRIPRQRSCSYESTHFSVPARLPSVQVKTYIVDTNWDWTTFGPDFKLTQLHELLNSIESFGIHPRSSIRGMLQQHQQVVKVASQQQFCHDLSITAFVITLTVVLLVILFWIYKRRQHHQLTTL